MAKQKNGVVAICPKKWGGPIEFKQDGTCPLSGSKNCKECDFEENKKSHPFVSVEKGRNIDVVSRKIKL